jgi:hypothetical protein
LIKRLLVLAVLLAFWTLTAKAQSDETANAGPTFEIQSAPISSNLAGPAQLPAGPGFLDMPNPLIPQDGPAPCPAGVGKPCALLGGRLYFRDPSHMTEHDATWGKAMRNPMMVVGGLLNLASTIADIEGTQACLRVHTCTEGNPLFGANPSRAKSYGIGIPMGFAIYSLSAWLKKNGDGNLAFGLLWGGTMGHTYEAAHGFAVANKESPAKPNSSTAKSFGIVIKF